MGEVGRVALSAICFIIFRLFGCFVVLCCFVALLFMLFVLCCYLLFPLGTSGVLSWTGGQASRQGEFIWVWLGCKAKTRLRIGLIGRMGGAYPVYVPVRIQAVRAVDRGSVEVGWLGGAAAGSDGRLGLGWGLDHDQSLWRG